MVAAGISLLAFSILSLAVHYTAFGGVPVFALAGAILLVVGLLLLITELMESWLSKGQAALVDGLQAG
jgi:myo-inositol-1(or 4)-monophosphatase